MSTHFLHDSDIIRNSPKRHLGYFCETIRNQEFVRISQSGHTATYQRGICLEFVFRGHLAHSFSAFEILTVPVEVKTKPFLG